MKITDKAKKGGSKTKNIIIKGFPAVIFCTGNLKIDEQESTRFFLLSPKISQEKIRAAIREKIKKGFIKFMWIKLMARSPRNFLTRPPTSGKRY